MPITPSILILAAFILQILSRATASHLDSAQCAKDANATYSKAPNDTFFYNQHGKPTGDRSQAWGISYESCVKLCHAPDNDDGFTWDTLINSSTAWLICWLALTAQLPFQTKDKLSDFMALLLALGSPALITYSLTLTILDARWINQKFRPIKENNKPLKRPLQVKAIKAARALLIESHQIPIQIYNGPRRELAQLVVRPANWAWWQALREEIQKTKCGWTYSLYAQVGWVCATQLLGIISFFTTVSSHTHIGLGLAINSMWIWMVPVVLGWVYVGTQTSSGSIKNALTSVGVPMMGEERNATGDSVGIRDRTVFDDAYTLSWSSSDVNEVDNEEQTRRQGEQGSQSSFSDIGSPTQHSPIGKHPRSDSHNLVLDTQQKNTTIISCESISSQTDGTSENVGLRNLSKQGHISAIKLGDIEQQPRAPLLHPTNPSSLSSTFLGFPIVGCELEPGPIFNYARIWSHMNAVEHVAEAFRSLTERQKARQTVRGQPWTSDPDEWDTTNLDGSPEQLSRYASESRHDQANLSIHEEGSPDLLLNSLTSAFVAVFLQWTSTGAAIVISYLTPVIGLGCQSGSYLIYGLVSTFSWLLLTLSAYLSHRWSLLREHSPNHYHRRRRHSTLLGCMAVTTRLSGKLLAAVNAIYIVVISTLQLTGLLDNCWCAAGIPTWGRQGGWVILYATDAQISAVSQPAWIGGVFMSVVSAALVTVYLFVARGDEVFKRR